MSDDSDIFEIEFRQAFTPELASSMYCHYFSRRKHEQEPIPDPKDVAEEMARWIAEQFIYRNQD